MSKRAKKSENHNLFLYTPLLVKETITKVKEAKAQLPKDEQAGLVKSKLLDQ